MVQDDGQVGDGFGKIRKLWELREVHPALQGQSHAGQHASASPELLVAELTLHSVCGRVFDLGMRVPRHRMADAPEPVGTGRLQCLEHRGDAVAEQQIGVPDDCRRSPSGAIETTGARCSQPLYELDLADRAHLLGTIRAVHGARFDEHGGTHVVATAHIVGQLVEQIPLVGNARRAKIPEVVMGIADRQLRLQRRFLGQRQPVIASERHETTPFLFIGMEHSLSAA